MFTTPFVLFTNRTRISSQTTSKSTNQLQPTSNQSAWKVSPNLMTFWNISIVCVICLFCMCSQTFNNLIIRQTRFIMDNWFSEMDIKQTYNIWGGYLIWQLVLIRQLLRLFWKNALLSIKGKGGSLSHRVSSKSGQFAPGNWSLLAFRGLLTSLIDHWLCKQFVILLGSWRLFVPVLVGYNSRWFLDLQLNRYV